jgi:filamentous hemagglutinin family protein
MQVWRYQFWIAGCIVVGCLAREPVLGQIVPDRSLPVNSAVSRNGRTLVINGGATAGGNLFHSFERFSVPTGTTAFFKNAVNIQNIITRVTGGAACNIDGGIKANGTANLFLLNPRGIIFGPNARLNIGGSFVASTAQGFRESRRESVECRQSCSQTPADSERAGHRLSGDPETGAVEYSNRPAGLAVPVGRTLALVGGDITLEGGILRAPQGRIELDSAAGAGEISLNPTGIGFALGVEGVPSLGNINLSKSALIDTSGSGGGEIQLQGGRIAKAGGSAVLSVTLGSKARGEIKVSANDCVELTGISADGGNSCGLCSETAGNLCAFWGVVAENPRSVSRQRC